MKKLIFLAVMLSLVEASFEQETKKQFIHKGVLRATGTFAFTKSENIYLHGVAEYYIAARLCCMNIFEKILLAFINCLGSFRYIFFGYWHSNMSHSV